MERSRAVICRTTVYEVFQSSTVIDTGRVTPADNEGEIG